MFHALLLLSTLSVSQAAICLFGGYCRTTADCVAGAQCQIQSAYYSQCVPLPPASTCIAQFGTCGGSGQTVPAGQSCCAGTTCVASSAYYSQCKAIVQPCTNPTGYQTGCEELTKSSMLNLLDMWNAAVQTGITSNVVNMYRSNDPLLLATVANAPITSPSGLTAYFDKFLLNSPVATVLESFAFLNGNILAGLYNFDVNVFNSNCAPMKCGPTTSTPCTGACRTVVPARFTYAYECEMGTWKIAHHHSSKLPMPVSTNSTTVKL